MNILLEKFSGIIPEEILKISEKSSREINTLVIIGNPKYSKEVIFRTLRLTFNNKEVKPEITIFNPTKAKYEPYSIDENSNFFHWIHPGYEEELYGKGFSNWRILSQENKIKYDNIPILIKDKNNTEGEFSGFFNLKKNMIFFKETDTFLYVPLDIFSDNEIRYRILPIPDIKTKYFGRV